MGVILKKPPSGSSSMQKILFYRKMMEEEQSEDRLKALRKRIWCIDTTCDATAYHQKRKLLYLINQHLKQQKHSH